MRLKFFKMFKTLKNQRGPKLSQKIPSLFDSRYFSDQFAFRIEIFQRAPFIEVHFCDLL